MPLPDSSRCLLVQHSGRQPHVITHVHRSSRHLCRVCPRGFYQRRWSCLLWTLRLHLSVQMLWLLVGCLTAICLLFMTLLQVLTKLVVWRLLVVSCSCACFLQLSMCHCLCLLCAHRLQSILDTGTAGHHTLEVMQHPAVSFPMRDQTGKALC